MGGLLILTAALVPTLLWADLTNPYVWIAVLATAAFGGDRVRRRLPEDRPPLASRPAAALQDGLADRRRPRRSASRCWCCAHDDLYNTRLIFPFFKRLIPDLGWCLRAVRGRSCCVGSTNAVNLTDGLDGLAISVFAVAAAALHRAGLRHRPPRVRRATCCSCSFAAGGGADDLLRRAGRRQPRVPLVQLATRRTSSWATSARSALGGALGTVAILIKQELLLSIVGGVFVLEALSVIIQVGVVQADRASASSGWRRCTTTSS